MAGSKFVYTYTADSGKRYLVELDESNVRAAGGFIDAVPGDRDLDTLPRTLKMRYVNVRSASGISRRLPVGSTAADLWTGDVTSVQLPVWDSANNVGTLETFYPTVNVGEKYRKPFLGPDSGQTDGTGGGGGTAPPNN